MATESHGSLDETAELPQFVQCGWISWAELASSLSLSTFCIQRYVEVDMILPKRFFFFTAASVLLVLSTLGNAFAGLDDDLIAYWSFDQCDATDVSGNGFDGVIGGDPANTTCVDGVKGKALRFQGIDATFSDRGGHVLIPFIDLVAQGDFSVCMWVNEEAMEYPHGEAYVFFGDHTSGGIYILNSTVTQFGYDDSGPGLEQIEIDFDASFVGRFIHYCLVYRAGEMQAYIQSDLRGALRFDLPVLPAKTAAIARHWWYEGAASSTRFTGSIDEVRIYGRALAEYEIRLLAASSAYIGVTSLSDSNNNGTLELAILKENSDDTASVIIKDSETKEWISEVQFQSLDRTPIGVAGVVDSTGYPAVAVLFRKPNGQGVVQLRDALTGQWIHQMYFFGSEWEVESITSQDSDMNGISEIAVLGNSDDGTRSAIQIKDAETRELVKWIELPME
jgi:hypothetical protein